MSNIKRYSVALVFGALAGLFLLTFGLAFTVWAPEEQIEASGESNLPFVMTRTGVLSLYSDEDGEVTVTLSGADTEETVWLAVGTAEDIAAWLDNRPYDEVVGLENLKTLKFVDLPADKATQSGQSDADQQEAAKGSPSADPLASDMWISLDEGVGTLTKQIPSGLLDKSVLIASDGVNAAPTLTLSWETTKTNLVAWVALAFATIAAFLAGISAWGTFRRQRRRELRAERLRQSFAADSTQTTMIPAVSASEEAVPVDTETEPDQVETGEEGLVEVDGQPEPLEDVADPADGDETVVDPDSDVSEVAEQELVPLGEQQTEEEAEPADIPASIEETDPIPTEEVDPRVETISTDSGMINLSAFEGGGVFPTRRALREAETRGVDRVVVEGYEFVTGSQPVMETSTTNDDATDAASEVLGKRSSRGNKWRDAFSDWKGRNSTGKSIRGSAGDSPDRTNDEKEGSSE